MGGVSTRTHSCIPHASQGRTRCSEKPGHTLETASTTQRASDGEAVQEEASGASHPLMLLHMDRPFLRELPGLKGDGIP